MRPHVIVFGNEKGGTGKSTLAIHVSVYLLNQGLNVGTIDVDARQGTFSRYIANRKAAAEKNPNLKLSRHIAVNRSNNSSIEAANAEDKRAFENAMTELSDCQFIIIDAPGNDTFLSQLVHSYADKLITPLNDSFIDLDVLVHVENNDVKSIRPSIYAEMVWNQRKTRAVRGEKPIDWIVVRNRLTTFFTRNRHDINIVLEALAKRIGFRLGTGFCERVIFKELFLSGLTVLDLDKSDAQLSMSHISARQELRDLINFMELPGL